MTVATPTRERSSDLYPVQVKAFATMGWSADEWDDLYDFLTVSPQLAPGAYALASWLLHPPAVFVTALTPDQVKDVFARHGKRARQVLRAMAAGVSERFTVGCWCPPWDKSITTPTAVSAWRYAATLGLTEPDGVGWLVTGLLRSPEEAREETTALIRAWTDRFGPDAWLFVLAGITLDEAIAMGDARTTPTQEQLRVMVALNGHNLPDGI